MPHVADVDLSLPLLLDEAKASAVRLKEAWPWLGEMLEPGTVTVVERNPDLRNADIDEAEHWKDQAARFRSVQAGIVPSGPHPSAIRVGAASARRQIMEDVCDVAEALWRSVNVDTTIDLIVLAIDPTTRVREKRCDRCCGEQLLPRPADDDGKAPREVCPKCEGRGTEPTNTACMACLTLGACSCDLADAIVAVGMAVILDQLPRVTDPDVAAEAQRMLGRADERARNIAGVGEDKRIIKAPCPACGRRGDLVAEVSSLDASEWKVRCEHPGCVCRGPGCGCGRAVRWPGRKHVWPAAEWDGPNGLAKRLGVDLPGTERRAAKPDPKPEPEVALAVAA